MYALGPRLLPSLGLVNVAQRKIRHNPEQNIKDDKCGDIHAYMPCHVQLFYDVTAFNSGPIVPARGV